VNTGELVVVQGARAAGKTALLAICAARLAPDEGTVWISDRNVGDLQRSSLPLVRRNVAYLPPAPPLSARTTPCSRT
jgi:ABC-type ATPase involved in cell division